MNLRFVEAYYWAVTLKSITRAAERLCVTQSALSSRIAALEEELGVLLLDRRDRQFRLTAAGTRFLRHAERLLALQREIRGELGSAAERADVLRVGVIESVLHSWLIDWVQELRRQHPGLQLELMVETTPVLLDHMRRGAADVVLAALPADGDGIASRALAPMPMAFAGPAPARRGRALAFPELVAAHELLTFQRGSQPHVALLELCRRTGVQAPRVHNISSISAMVSLVEQGFGVATLPRAAVQRLAATRALAPVRVDAALDPLPIHLSWRDDPATPIVGEAVASVRAHDVHAAPGGPRRAARGHRAGPGGSSKESMTA